MLDFLLNLLRVAPVVSALLLVAAVNTKREHRVRQTWVPALAVIFAVVALIYLYRINDAVTTGAEQANQVIPFLPNNVGTAWLYIAENSVVLLVFALLKFLSKPVFTRIFTKGRQVGQLLVARVYVYDLDFDLWFVERRHRRTRDFYRALYWASMAMTVIFIAFALTFPGWPGFSAVAFPAMATMIIGEFYFAVDGLTKEEYESHLFGEQDYARRVGNYGPLREVLKSTFPERVIADGVHLSSLAAMESAFRVGEMTRSTRPGAKIAGNYFERLRLEGSDIDVNLVGASAQLMSGKNVLFANPFYKDLTPYLALPAYRTLLEGGKCLIVAGRDPMAEELANWIAGGLGDITGVPSLWKVRALDSVSRDDLDVGILRFADLHNVDLLVNNDDFFRDVDLIILAEPALMLATGQLGLEIVLDRCSQDSPVTVAAFDANHDGLVDTLSHLMKSSLTEVVASPLPVGASCEVVWQADGPHLHTSILPGVSRYLGVGTEISAVALKYQVDQVHWVGGTSFPVTDMKWIAEQYYAAINQFADLDMSQDALSDSIVAVASPWHLGQSDNYFLVVEDETRNIYETVRQFATRAKRSGFINLISDDYLLRDYMTGNREVFSVDPKAIPSIVPDYTRTERNVILRLLLMLESFGLTESELDGQLALLQWSPPAADAPTDTSEGGDWEPDALRQLRLAIGQHTGCWNAPLSSATANLASAADSTETRFFLEEGSSLDEILATLGPAYFFVEDDVDGVNVIGSMLLGHVYQAILPGMFLTYGGKHYEVQSIHGSTERPRVILRRAADHIRDRRAYRQLRRFTLTSITRSDAVTATKAVGSIQVRRLTADIEAESLGYIESDSRSHLGDGRRVEVHGVPPRIYRRKDVLEIDVSEAPAEVRRTLAVLLNEVLVTVFPHGSPFISVVTEDDHRSLGELLPELHLHDRNPADAPKSSGSMYVFEDSMVDLGLTSAVERNWERLLEIVTDYLDWNQTEPPEPTAAAGASTQADPAAIFPDRPVVVTSRKAGFVARTLERIRDMLTRRGKDSGVSSTAASGVAMEPVGEQVNEAPNSEAQATGTELDSESAEEVWETDASQADAQEGHLGDLPSNEPTALDAAPTDFDDDPASTVSDEDEPRRPDDPQ
jgi:hypothetical protein